MFRFCRYTGWGVTMWQLKGAPKTGIGGEPRTTVAPPLAQGREESQAVPAAHLGRSIVIKGEVAGSEDLTLNGEVEGSIRLPAHTLTVGPDARIRAQVFAKTVTVLGSVTGSVTADGKIDIRSTGSIEGDLIAPRIAIHDGAHFCGTVEMQPRDVAARDK